VDIGCLCSKYPYSVELKKYMYLSKENILNKKQQHVAPCFPVKIDLVSESNTSCNLGFSRWRYTVFVPNRPILLS
jgi:hypothetical protein